MAKKRIAHKIQFHVDAADTAVFTQIPSIKKIVDPGKSRDSIDVTCLADDIEVGAASPVLKLGDYQMSLFWDEADTAVQGLIDDLVESGADVPFKIVFPFTDGTITKTFDGWIKELADTTYEVKGEVMRDITIHVTSKPVTT